MNRNMTNRLRKGATMLESLFAIFLVTVCAIILTSSMPVATKSRKKADLHNKAMAMCQKQIEAIRGVGYANITPTQLASYGLIDNSTAVTTSTYSFTNSDSSQLDSPAQILPSGVGRVVIEQAEVDMRRVTVFTQWTTGGVTYEYRIGTLVANL